MSKATDFWKGVFKNESKEWTQGFLAASIIVLFTLLALKITGGACV